MIVLLVGVDAPGALARLCRRALRRLGHPCEMVDYRRRAEEGTLASGLLDAVRGVSPDLLLVVKGERLGRQLLEQVRQSSAAPLVCWHPDDPLRPEHASRNLIDAIGVYDLILTWSDKLASRLTGAGAKRVERLRFGFDPELHGPVAGMDHEGEPGGGSGGDPGRPHIVFAGTWTIERERWLESIADLALVLIGNGWESIRRGSPLAGRVRGRAIYEAELADLYEHTPIVLNLLRPQNRHSHNMRTFEIPAAGAFQLSTRSEEVLELFREGEEIACFGSPAELRSRVLYYLSEAEERRRIARAGVARLHEDGHTYDRRMRRLIELLEAPRGSTHGTSA